MKVFKPILLSLALGLGVAGAAEASTVGFNLLGQNFRSDKAGFTLINTSATASIQSIQLSIGDTRYNFDSVRFGANANGTVYYGDTGEGGARTKNLSLGFKGFTSQKAVWFELDIDQDINNNNSGHVADYRYVLFNNGVANNATITVRFTDGTVLTQAILDRGGMGPRSVSPYQRLAMVAPDYPDNGGGSNGGGSSMDPSPVPLPAALPLMLGGLFGLGLFARRRKA